MFAIRICSLLIGGAITSQCLASTGSAADDTKLKAYGAHLSRECTTCHRIDGTDNGIPSIIGWDTDQFVTTLKFYQEGLRNNDAMVSVAKSLDEEQLRALAAYFGGLKPPPKKSPQRAGDRR